MSDKRYITAFEIGSSKIKGAVACVEPDGTLNVIACEEEPHVDSVRYGSIRRVQDVSDRILAVTARLEQSPALANARIRGAYVSIGGISLRSENMSVKRSFPVETEITDTIIKQMKEEAKAKADGDRVIESVLSRSFVVDNLPQKNPVGIYGKEISAEFTLVGCRRQITDNINRVFSERLPMAINGTVVRPLAKGSLVLTGDDRDKGCMLVDFGAETITVSIYKGGTLRYLVTIPMGARNITRDLTALNFVERRAEEIKKSVGDVDPKANASNRVPDGLDTTEINACIAARTGELITNILEQLTYAGFKAADLPAGIVLTGGGANLRGFVSLMASYSNMKVRIGLPLGNFRYADSAWRPADMVDILSIIYTASKSPEKICIEFPQPVSVEPVDDGVSRVGSDMNSDLDDLDDPDPDEIKPQGGKQSSKKAQRHSGPSLIDRLKDRMFNLLIDDTSTLDDNESDDN